MPERPNILFITTDMHRFDALGCYGNEHITTPNIDALAASGVRFTNAFVNNPVCMPSRASLFTGKVPSAHGVRWNSAGLRPDEVTISRRLQESGYQTAAIGKMHWGDTEADFGLDYVNITDGHSMASPGVVSYREHLRSAGVDDEYYVGNHPDFRGFPEYQEFYGAMASPLPREHHVDGFIADATREFLKRRDRSNPFYCWTSFSGPHLPLDPTEPWLELYDNATIPLPEWHPDEFEAKPPEQLAFQRHANRGNALGDYRTITQDSDKLRRFIRYYWAKISMIDHFIGEIIAQLEASGDRDKTVVIFTSDHGDFVGHHGLLFKSAFLYDDLLRVPLIVSARGRFAPGVVDALVEEIDVPVTMLALANLGPHEGLQGDDLTSLLKGRNSAWRDAAYAEAVDQRSIRTAEWKLVHYRGRDYGELYHLTEDPGELVNRYDDPACAQVRDGLRAKLVDRMVELEARSHAPVGYVDLEHPDGASEPLRLPYL